MYVALLGGSEVLEMYFIVLLLSLSVLYCVGAVYGCHTMLDAMERKDWYSSVKKQHGPVKWLSWFWWAILAILTIAFCTAIWPFPLALEYQKHKQRRAKA